MANLKPKWTLTTDGDVISTPAVYQGMLYVPDRNGDLLAVRASDGAVIWSHKVGDYTGITQDASRSTPVVNGDELVIGDGLGNLIGVNRSTGAFLWRTQLDGNPYARITGSPILDHGIIYSGVSSGEEEAPDGYQMTFRGSVVAVDATTGKILWRTYMAPPGYTGDSVWGSTPVVDHRTGMLYVSTGNNYSVPQGVCELPTDTGCAQPADDDYLDAIVAMNLRTGKVIWSYKTLSSDVFTDGSSGLDYDFASGPNLFTTVVHGRPRDLVGVGQKSGIYWAFDPVTGKLVWKTEVGPGSKFGGIQWGSATDGHRIYVGIANYAHKPYTITSANGQTTTITGGAWSALDAATGKILWQTADPQGVEDMGFVSTANGVVYANSLAPTGTSMYALDAATGEIKWSFDPGGSTQAGAAIVKGTVYWGSGFYIPWSGAGENNKLYAFSFGPSGS